MANHVDDAVVQRANDLYWHSEKTVTELLDELDLSRNALYNALEPLSTGHPCPDCSGTLVFTNRSNRSSSRGSCPDCGRVMEIDAEAVEADAKATGGARTSSAAGSGDAAGKAPPAKPTREGTGASSQRVTPPRYQGHDVAPPAPAPPRAAVVGAIAVGGAALGALIALAARRLT